MANTSVVRLRGVTLACSDTGTGPVVLEAHGLGSSRAVSRRTGLTDFGPVATVGRRLVAYDARGHGESSGTADPDDYTWPALAGDLLALADHVAPAAPVSGLGLSMGTGTVLHAALQQPGRFDRLVLTAPPTAWETRAAQSAAYEQLVDTVERLGPAALPRLLATSPVPAIFADVPGYPPLPDIAADLLPTVFRGAGRTDLPPLAELAALAHPTLVLAWDTDPGHPVSTAEQLAATLPNAELHVARSATELRAWGRRAATFLAA